MKNSFPPFGLADHDYRVLSAQEQNTFLKLILSSMIYSAALDGEGADALAVFDDYEWLPRPGVDTKAFSSLLEAGKNGTMNTNQLDQFMDMVSATGQVHLYFWIRKGLSVLSE